MSASNPPRAEACTPPDQHQQLVQLAGRIARLNPDSATIGAGMLASLVADARSALGQQDGGAEGSAHVCTPAFIHTYRPALCPAGEHSWQRRYGPANARGHHPQPLAPRTDKISTTIVVERDGCKDVAELELSIGLYTEARITLRLTPEELREAARRLLDAAHDIEAHPAATLEPAAAESAAA